MFRYSTLLLYLTCINFLKVNCGLLDGLVNLFDQAETAHPLNGQRLLFPIDLSTITNQIQANEFIFDQNPEYRKGIQELKSILQDVKSAKELAQLIQELRNATELNQNLLSRAIVGALITRADRAEFYIPTLIEILPELVVPDNVLIQINTQRTTAAPQCVVVDETSGLDNGIENRLWYFRQDPLVNANHWFWHLEYPINAIIEGDRRGEIYYDFHHNLMARYGSERQSNSLPPVTPFALERNAVMLEGYRSHLRDSNSKQNWTDRPPLKMIPSNVQTSFTNLTIDETLQLRQRIYTGIDTGYFVLPNGTNFPLRNVRGIDVLGNIVEASVFSLNPAYYGKFGYHNSGHIYIGNVMHPNDPHAKHPPGVMSDTATSMRDIIFYRWHTHIDQIYQRHKNTLTPYQPAGGELPLTVTGVGITQFQVQSKIASAPVNTLNTFWSSTTYNLTNGLDLRRSGTSQPPVKVCVKHLDHDDFEYRFNVVNTNSPMKAAVRIFMAPRYLNDEIACAFPTSPLLPDANRYTMKQQRPLFFVLDTFSVDLTTGSNIIVRQSSDSTLTVTANQKLQELNGDQGRTTVYCGCGWPDYMLLPKGKPGPCGMVYDVFAMITQESALTTIPPLIPPPPLVNQQNRTCKEAYLFCGSFGKKFPDTRPMGYPFDRQTYTVTDYFLPLLQAGPYSRVVRDLDEYIRPSPNMATAQVRIIHTDT